MTGGGTKRRSPSEPGSGTGSSTVRVVPRLVPANDNGPPRGWYRAHRTAVRLLTLGSIALLAALVASAL